MIVMAFAAAVPVTAQGSSGTGVAIPAEPLVSLGDRRGGYLPSPLHEPCKKARWLLAKRWRPNVHTRDTDLQPRRRVRGARARGRLFAGTPVERAQARLAAAMVPVGERIQPITTLYNIWNREAMALFPGQPYRIRFQHFMRDHFTQQSTQVDMRLAGILTAAALRFRAPRIDIVSGYRSPKYNLMLRKKGHQVARESQHTLGHAVDFRIRGVSTEALRDFVRGLHMGGVGYYPRTGFVHADTGRIRTWRGS